MLAVVILALAALVVFAVAAAVVGREAHRLDALPPRLVYDMEQAVAYVADHLPTEVSARISYDDVRDLLDWHLVALRAQGLGTAVDLDRPQDPSREVVVDDASALDRVMADVDRDGRGLDAVDVVVVLDLHDAYLRAIGAVGDEAGDEPAAEATVADDEVARDEAAGGVGDAP